MEESSIRGLAIGVGASCCGAFAVTNKFVSVVGTCCAIMIDNENGCPEDVNLFEMLTKADKESRRDVLS